MMDDAIIDLRCGGPGCRSLKTLVFTQHRLGVQPFDCAWWVMRLVCCFAPPYQLDGQQYTGRSMHEQVEYIQGACQRTLKQHTQFFNQMGLRYEWRTCHPNGQGDQHEQGGTV